MTPTFNPVMPQPIAITTPLYYVNGLPHIGSAYPTIAADALARFYRLQGQPTLFITGTDEHGQKIERTAASENVPPQVHCDRIVTEFQNLWSQLNIKYDRFARTTDPRHQAIVNEFFALVYKTGDIYLSQQQGWYCVACEEFKEERELLAKHYCPTHTNVACEWRDEANYFFRLSKYQTQLEQLYRDRPEFIQPEARRNEVLGFVAQGLTDFSISRINLSWGFPVPTDPNHTLYVWFDALLGYITALLDPDDEPTLANALKNWYPIKLHIIGKDILRFHAVYFPAMLMSAGLEISGGVFGHGLLTKDGIKMGKTMGNTIDPYELVQKYGADSIRYYFLKEIEFGKDGDFSEERFISSVNADLANSLGNLLNRTLGMVAKYCDLQIPDPHQFTEIDIEVQNLLELVKTKATNLGDRVSHAYTNLAFRSACEQILELIWDCNKLIDDTTPWKLFKLAKTAEVNQILYTILESVRIATYLFAPIVPQLSQEAYRQLGLEFIADHPPAWDHTKWGILKPTPLLEDFKPLFQRIEIQRIEVSNPTS
jgi:methionyl-tRNA synthetase